MECSICGKSFDNRKSLLRHGSYCRSSRSRVKHRKKACAACTKAKTRCDLSYPSCSRCLSKNITCYYVLPPPSTVAASNFLVDTTGSLLVSASLPSSGTQRLLLNESTESQPSELDFERALDPERWLLPPMNGVASTTLSDDTLDTESAKLFEYPQPATGAPGTFIAPDIAVPSDQWKQPSHSEPSSGVEMAIDDFRLESLDTLEFDSIFYNAPVEAPTKVVPRRHLSLSSLHVLCTLRSYPSMMISDRDLPPFIHPYFGFGNNASKMRIGALKSDLRQIQNCALIVKWWSVRTNENTAYVWNTVRAEQERLLAEYSDYTGAEAVAALQALTNYILLRCVDDKNPNTSFDVALVEAMVILFVKASAVLKSEGQFSQGIPIWETWILAESLKRTAILLCVIDLMFDYSSIIHSYQCDGTILRSMALPCGRQLWRASSRDEWEAEYKAERAFAAGRKQLTCGDLLDFHLKPEGELADWLSQLDDFGNLVVAAASVQR